MICSSRPSRSERFPGPTAWQQLDLADFSRLILPSRLDGHNPLAVYFAGVLNTGFGVDSTRKFLTLVRRTDAPLELEPGALS